MKNSEVPLSEAVFDLIYSGARGAMTNGDSYGVWLAGGNNDTSMGVDTWKQKFSVELASRIALRVKDRGFKGKPALHTAIIDAVRVAESVGDVVVIISSNGDSPIQGTPFDEQLNARIKQLAPEMQRAKAIVNTVLVAQNGKFVAWAVNSPEFLIIMPDVPPRPIEQQVVIATTPPSVTNATVVAAPPPKLRVAANPIIITRETVDHEKQIVRAMASTDIRNSTVTNAAPAIPANTNTAPPTAVSTNA
ncbi:MAG TPA: hypothetical protein VK530_06535, partial [Candidatus Acidoferrum sp.]|nr:hypothetical protein [Candidatus Acidoferrum sp.]